MIKIDKNGWAKVYGVDISISDTKLIVAPEDKNAEILEVNLFELMEANSMYFTRWEFLKLKLIWVWSIIKMKA